MSPFAKYALAVLLGILIGVGTTFAVIRHKADNSEINMMNTIAGLRRRVESEQKTSEALATKLKAANANPAAQMLAQTGHVMNEDQCRTWMSMQR